MPKRRRSSRKGKGKGRRRTKRFKNSPMGPYGWKTPIGKFEKKAADIGVATYQVNTTGSITLLAVPTLGTDYTNRIGRRIRLRSLYIRGHVNAENAELPITTAGVETLAQQARLIIVVDRQPNATVFGITDLLVSARAESQLNLNNRDRFKVLVDKTYQIPNSVKATPATPTSFIGNFGGMFKVKVFKKLNLPVQFNSTNGGTIADITSNAIYMVWIGINASGATDVNATVSTRIRFDDD